MIDTGKDNERLHLLPALVAWPLDRVCGSAAAPGCACQATNGYQNVIVALTVIDHFSGATPSHSGRVVARERHAETQIFSFLVAKP